MAETQAVENRNVVLLGKTGAGKSTVASKISGLEKFEVKNVASSVTANVKSVFCTYFDEDSRIQYCFKVIVFDTKRKNFEIMTEIKQVFQNEAPEGVHLVLFVFRRGRLTEEEKRTFDFITKHFRAQMSGFSALVITGCEDDSEVARKEFLESLRSEAPDLASFMKKGIYAVGFPDLSMMKPGVRKALEEDMQEEIKMLRKIVINADQKCLVGNEMFQLNFWEKLEQCVIL